MSHATHDHATTAHPDAIRVVALAATISLNTLVLLLALRPLGPRLQRLVSTPPLRLETVPTPPKAPPPPPSIRLPVRHPLPHITMQPQQRPSLPTLTAVTPMSLPPTAIPRAPAITLPATITPTAVTPGTAAMSLATREAPAPRYPSAARRAGMEGTVTLLVLVDAAGRPQQVEVERGSGHALLDRTARLQVLQHWRFRPASAHGHATAAWARVSITFNLRKL